MSDRDYCYPPDYTVLRNSGSTPVGGRIVRLAREVTIVRHRYSPVSKI